MAFQGPVIESIGMRRGGLWFGLVVGAGMAAVFLLLLAGAFRERPAGCAAWALGAFTVLLLYGAISCTRELVRPLPLLRVSAEGLAFRIRTGRGYWEAPWSQVVEIRAGEDGEGNACLDVELRPEPANPLPSVRMNSGLGPEHVLRFQSGNLAGDLALMAQRLEAYRRSFGEGR